VKQTIPLGYCSLDVRRDESYALIDQLSEQHPIHLVCQTFGVPKSCYYGHRKTRQHIDPERVKLKALVNKAFTESRSAAGSRTIKSMLNEDGITIGRFKVRRLMSELGLICKQPGPHAYKQATVERPDIPNELNREFEVSEPNAVWCGDITYIWAGKAWVYQAVVIVLYARRVIGWAISKQPDSALVIKASVNRSRSCRWPCASMTTWPRRFCTQPLIWCCCARR